MNWNNKQTQTNTAIASGSSAVAKLIVEQHRKLGITMNLPDK